MDSIKVRLADESGALVIPDGRHLDSIGVDVPSFSGDTGVALDTPVEIAFAFPCRWVSVENVDAAKNEFQAITVVGTGGHFHVTYGGQTTGELAYNVSAADVQTALRALSSINGAHVTVTLVAGVYTIEFMGDLAATNVAEVTTTDDLTGTGHAATVTTVQEGAADSAILHVSFDGGATYRTIQPGVERSVACYRSSILVKSILSANVMFEGLYG